MNKTYITVAVLVLVVLGGVSFMFKGKKLEAPVVDNKPSENSAVSSGMPAIDAPDTKETSVVKEFTVSGQNYSFSPSSITVKKGDKVKITFENTVGFHNFVIDEFGVAMQTITGGAQESVEFTADKVGSFQYYCSVGSHRAMGMWGTLKVE